MSGSTYSRSERGGGIGDTGRMRAAILNQINSWWHQAKWADPDRADRILEKMNEAPETFISPNPSTNHKEEASRIYEEIKDEYSLRSVTDLKGEHKEYQQRADRHYEQKTGSEPDPELGGAPEPAETETPEPSPEPAETEAPEPSPEPAETEAPEPSPEPADITPGSGPADVGRSPEPAETQTAEPAGRPEPKPAEEMGVIELVVTTFKEMIKHEKRQAKAEVRDTPTAESPENNPTQKTIKNFS